MKCPRCGKGKANYDKRLGVLPCSFCLAEDDKWSLPPTPEFYSINKLHRVQKQRDKAGGDMLQPYIKNKPNPDFFKRYPNRVKSYGVEEELKKL